MSMLTDFEEQIGYRFQNEGLLRQALMHSSYANEKHMKRFSDNERLEFLGDAVLEITTSEFLYHAYPDVPEGELTKKRASIVCEPTLALCAKDISLGERLLLGKGEELTGGRERNSILSDALEALIGAIYLDGGAEPAKAFINAYILKDVEHKQLFHDSKTTLQEVVQSRHGQVEYVLTGESGPDHNKRFSVEVRLDENVIATGVGRSKKAAEQEAAYRALLVLRENKTNSEV